MSKLKKPGRKSKYLKLLSKSGYWQEVRQRALVRADFHCQYPDCTEILGLECHHEVYYVDGKSIIGRELEFMQHMKILCAKHHHKGAYKI